MVLLFYQNGRLSERRGQVLIDMFKHPDFRLEDMQISTTVLRRLERPFQATAVVTYTLWKEGDGDQKLEMVMRDYLARSTLEERFGPYISCHF